MSDLDERLAALSPEKRALFEKLLREKLRQEAPLAEQGRAENAFPISVTQQGIWFLEQLRPKNPAYRIPAAVHLRGPLDTRVLLDAVNTIVARHEALRSTFHLRDGRPVQVVRPALTVELPEVDLRGAGLTGDALRERIARELDEPFDLATGPLLRLRLLRLAEREHVLAVAMHHLVSDGWSVGVLVGELATVYEAFVAGRPSPLGELPIQYGDFAAWQQEWLRTADLAGSLAYWRGHLAGAPAALDLPTDRPRPAVQGFDGGSQPFALPATVLAELTALGKRRGATTYMVLLAAFAVLLHRYTGQDDVVVGVPAANRGRAEVEPLIGFFVNILPVRTDLSGDHTFVELLDRVRTACLGAYGHQELPFEKVVEALRAPRDLSRPPVFQACLSYQSDPLSVRTMAGVELRRIPLRAEGARFDLELQFFDVNGGLTGWFEYNRDLFEPATMARMADHLRRLVEQAVAHPEVPVSRLDLLDDAERRRVLVEVNATDRDWPGAGLVHECVEERARATPAAAAVRFAGADMSYAELNARANRLARRLRARGVGRGVLVGVAMQRSVELVVALLAVLKAGGAYVPLDPGYPRDRLEFMVADAGVPVLLTQRRVLDDGFPVPAAVLVPAGVASPAGVPAVEVLTVDEIEETHSGESTADLAVEVGPEDAAYVIYTSGSTGRPKGVVNVHGAIRSRLLWMQDEYHLTPADRVVQKTPFSFDVSVWEFFWPLMVGATLVVAEPGGHRDPHYLAGLIQAERVTTADFVPSMLEVFLAEPAAAGCTSLRRVFCSGEALSRDLRDRFCAASDAELHNLYGPTEAAVDVTAWACRPDDGDGPVPIGFPVANTRMYVLDRWLRPVPVGVAGELCIGGRQLARGYLGRPGLTADRFVPDPYGGAGGRLYRTGDLARWRADGAIEYLGRLDRQVKLRGFRIELGEIEAVLAEHPGVGQAVVVAREFARGGTRLVAYLTAAEAVAGTGPAAGPAAGSADAGGPGGPGAPGPVEFAAHVRHRLPDYMVPSAFVVLPRLPLTPNGKLDVAALPAPETDRRDLAVPFAAPRDELERALADLWRGLLGVEQVGLHDNFFDLGGHSLLMAELRARLAATAGREVSMVELFQYPTIGSLAEHLNRVAAGGADAGLSGQDRAENRRRSQLQRQQAAARRASSRNRR